MSKRIHDLFTRIYKRYDLMNHLFSAGMDKFWRRKAEIAALSGANCRNVIDIGAGTGDLSIGIALRAGRADRDVHIEAIDLNEKMMAIGRRKAAAKGLRNIRFAKGDALRLKYADGSFDTAVSAFVLRNLDDFSEFSAELSRVLCRNGRIVLLDMALPEGPSRHFFAAYFVLMRVVGKLVDWEAYTWLTGSVAAYDKKKAAEILRKNGFSGVRVRNVFPGVAFMITGTRQ